jgi:hypothetical protein
VKLKRIRIDKCLLKPNIPAGMNHLVIMSLVYFYKTSDDHTHPITVRKEGKHYRIMDGRHRWMASVIAGRRKVLAQIEE